MIRPKQQDSKSSIKPVSELNPLAMNLYMNTAKTLQNYLTNCIISKRTLDFYLKKTFEGDTALSDYNFYKELDPIKLKIVIETLLKNIKPESKPEFAKSSPIKRTEGNSTELAEDYKQRLKSFIAQVNNMIGSVKATKKAEFNLFKYILKELLPNIKSDQVKSDIQFIIQENANLESILDAISKDAEQFDQELIASSFADFNAMNDSVSRSPERQNIPVHEDEAPQQKTITKKVKAVFDEPKTESKNDPDSRDRKELNDLLVKAESSTIQKFLNDLKGSRKSSTRGEQSPGDLQLTIALLKKYKFLKFLTPRENESLTREFKEQTEELINKLREAQLDKEILQKEYEEKKASFELLKKKGFVEKENPNISLLETANKLLEAEKQNLQTENQNLLDHIKALQNDHEEIVRGYQDEKNNYNNEKESLLKTLRAIEAEFDKSKKLYQTKIQEKELAYSNTVKAYEDEIEEQKRLWEEERAAYAQEIDDRSATGSDERQKILARLYDKEKELQELQDASQKKLVELTKELQNAKETLLTELKESNKYKEKLNEILNENFQLDSKYNDLLKEKKELECELQELSIRLKLSQETFQRELYGAENKNKTEQYELIQKLAALEEKYRLCKAKNENLIEENQHIHNMLLKYNKSPSRSSKDITAIESPSQERPIRIEEPSIQPILKTSKSPRALARDSMSESQYNQDRISELEKFLVVKQEKPFKEPNPKDYLGLDLDKPLKKFSIEPVRYPLRHPSEFDEGNLDGRYGRNGSTESELNFGLNKELLSRTDAKIRSIESSIQMDILNRSAEDYKVREKSKDPARNFTVLNTVKSE